MKQSKRNLQQRHIRQIQKVVKRWGVVFMLLILPFCIIYLSGLPERKARLIAYSLSIFCFPFVAFWWSLDPKTFRVNGKSKLPGDEKHQRAWERGCRIAGVAVGLMILIGMSLPLARDIYGLYDGQNPIVIDGVISDNDTPSGAWCLSQSIKLQNAPNSDSYGLMFSLEPRLNRGDHVKFLAIPHSQLIIEHLTKSPGVTTSIVPSL